MQKWVSRAYNGGMFARKKRNRSGSVSIQIIDKAQRYRVVQTVGSARNPDDIEKLWRKGQHIVHDASPEQQQLLPVKTEADLAVENAMDSLANGQVHTIGPECIFGTLFDRLGFDAIPGKLFRHIVIARLAYPTSKLKTVDYLYRYRGITVGVDAVYRFLDTFNKSYKTQAQDIAYRNTKRTLGTISVVFYDMTTLYFEAEDEDDLRKIGFSKDGKFQHPQIMLGLLIGEGGFPIGYDIFEGNTFEGHTLLPTLEIIQKKYGFGKPVVVADAGLLSNENLRKLAEEGYRFIIGGRIRNESVEIQKQILEEAKGMKDGDSFVLQTRDRTRLVVTYTNKRAKKDAYNRERGLKKLRKHVKTGRLTKDSINDRGYNKFLTLEGEVKVTIDEEKVKEDARWDGLKGYLTNSRLSPKKVTENYAQLWQIEKAFRISKTDLKVRPIHHYLKRRIEAHICIAFVSYSIYKELERQLQELHVDMSARRAAELTHTMYELEYMLPDSQESKRAILRMDAEQQMLHDAIHD